MKNLAFLGSSFLGLTCFLLLPVSANANTTNQENISHQIQGIQTQNKIENQYIVILKEPRSLKQMSEESVRSFVKDQAESIAIRSGGTVDRRYFKTLRGFAVSAEPKDIDKIVNHPEVAFVEVNRKIDLFYNQSNAPWGLDRIDSRSGLDGEYTFKATGQGVNAYIIDTGIRSTHEQFDGRVAEGFSSIDDNRGTEDCMGHGTHVAGTVGSRDYGVAKDVTLYPVRVFGCSGSTTTVAILDGIEWVAQNAVAPAVANMSLGGGRSQALDMAVKNMIDAGVIAVVAAGNSNRDACEFSPAAVPEAITVGSTTSRDQRSSFSNYGRCVDVFAPGSDIESLWSNADDATSTISGTSMASPHVAGAVALMLEDNPNLTMQEAELIIKQSATKGIVEKTGTSSPNLMLFTSLHEIEGPLPDPENTCPECLNFEGGVSAGETITIPENDIFESDGKIKISFEADEGVTYEVQRKRFLWGWKTLEANISEDSERVLFEEKEGKFRVNIIGNEFGGNYKMSISF